MAINIYNNYPGTYYSKKLKHKSKQMNIFNQSISIIKEKTPEKVKEVLSVSIFDGLGNEVKPGTIVAYVSQNTLEYAVYYGVASIPYTGTFYPNRHRILLAKANSKGKIRKHTTGTLSLKEGTTNEFLPTDKLVAVKNALFTGNSAVMSCLTVIDKMKDDGLLPSDYAVE